VTDKGQTRGKRGQKNPETAGFRKKGKRTTPEEKGTTRTVSPNKGEK